MLRLQLNIIDVRRTKLSRGKQDLVSNVSECVTLHKTWRRTIGATMNQLPPLTRSSD